MDIKDLLLKHEGMRLKPYPDTTGNLTIGVGRNLTSKGITKEEALFMLDNDIEEVRSRLSNLTWYRSLDAVRQDVCINMAFNLGFNGFLRFLDKYSILQALQRKDFNVVSQLMLDTKWSKQVGNRANELAYMMKTGEYK
jgi:lysozyme